MLFVHRTSVIREKRVGWGYVEVERQRRGPGVEGDSFYDLSVLKSWGVTFWANWNCFDLKGATGDDRAEDSVGYDSGK